MPSPGKERARQLHHPAQPCRAHTQNGEAKGAYNGVRAIDESIPKLSLVEDRGEPKRRGRGVFVHNLSDHEVGCASDVLGLISHAQERRRVGETKMNKHSSRSHCVFTLTVTTHEFTSDGCTMECMGKLHLVDLAGSECAKSAGSGANDARERERKNINQSLLTLGRVISTLREAGKDGARIPYRDSKLTRLLQESLGGRCKTVVIATLSPSQLAVEESSSTLSYVEKAKGITNKPVATSFLKVGGPGVGPVSGRGDKIDANEASMQDWNAMLARMKYMEEQMNEAQAALARKHTLQAEIIARSEAAELARDTAQAELQAQQAVAEGLRCQLAEVEAERRAVAYLLRATRMTEEQLTRQAHGLIDTLEDSDASAEALHSALGQAAQREAAQSARREAMAAAMAEHLAESRAKLGALGQMLAEGRAAALTAASAAEEVSRSHTASMRGAAAQMAEVATAELTRSTDEIESTRTEACVALAARAESISSSLTAMAGAAEASHASVAAELGRLEQKLCTSEEQLRAWASAAEERRSAAADELRDHSDRMASSIAAAADAAAERMTAGASRLVEHKDALDAIEARMAETWQMAAQAAERLHGLSNLVGEDNDAAAARMASCAASIRSAAEAQTAGQRDKQLAEALAEAADALAATGRDAGATLERQAADLTAAAAVQRADDASSALISALGAARKAVAESAEQREAELAEAREALGAHQAALRDMEAKQASMRERMLKEVTEAVQDMLASQLAGLGEVVSAAVAHAGVSTGRMAEGAASSASALVATREALGTATQEMVSASEVWGASARGVADRMQAASATATSLAERVGEGERSTAAAHARVSELAAEWAEADAGCRAALGEAAGAQDEAARLAHEATGGQQCQLQGLSQLVQRVQTHSATTKEAVGAAADASEQMRDHICDARETGTAASAAVAEQLSALSGAQSAALGAEAAAAAEMLRTRPADIESLLAHRRTAEAISRSVAEAVRSATEEGVAAVSSAAADQAAMLEAAASTHGQAAGEAAAAVHAAMASVGGSGDAHNAALEASAAERAATAAAAASAERASREAQAAAAAEASAVLGNFVGESASVSPLHVDPRVPHGFAGPLVATPPEPELRAHLAAHGDAEPPLLAVSYGSKAELEAEQVEQKPAAMAPPPVSVSETDQENVPVAGRGVSPSYGSMPVAELRKMLEAAKLPSTGTKSDLVARLQRHSTGGGKRHRSPTKAKRPQSDPVSLESAGAPLSPSTKIPLATRSTSMNRA